MKGGGNSHVQPLRDRFLMCWLYYVTIFTCRSMSCEEEQLRSDNLTSVSSPSPFIFSEKEDRMKQKHTKKLNDAESRISYLSPPQICSFLLLPELPLVNQVSKERYVHFMLLLQEDAIAKRLLLAPQYPSTQSPPSTSTTDLKTWQHGRRGWAIEFQKLQCRKVTSPAPHAASRCC